MGLYAKVFRQVPGLNTVVDCSLGGWSSRCHTVCVVNAEGWQQPTPSIPAVALVAKKNINGGMYLYAASVVDMSANRAVAFGGNFIYEDDSRFRELCEKLLGQSFSGAVKCHDRIEGA